jgi:hypothetical protein
MHGTRSPGRKRRTRRTALRRQRAAAAEKLAGQARDVQARDAWRRQSELQAAPAAGPGRTGALYTGRGPVCGTIMRGGWLRNRDARNRALAGGGAGCRRRPEALPRLEALALWRQTRGRTGATYRCWRHRRRCHRSDASGFSTGAATNWAAGGAEPLAARTGAEGAALPASAGGATTGRSGRRFSTGGCATGACAIGGATGRCRNRRNNRFFLLRNRLQHISRTRDVRQINLGLDFFFAANRARTGLASREEPSAAERMYTRTFSASCSSRELECVFFSVTPTSGSVSRMALLFTSSSRARSLIRTLLIRPFVSPCCS